MNWTFLIELLIDKLFDNIITYLDEAVGFLHRRLTRVLGGEKEQGIKNVLYKKSQKKVYTDSLIMDLFFRGVKVQNCVETFSPCRVAQQMALSLRLPSE